MDFASAYDQGFVRVAACTIVTALADPRTNAAAVLEQARECDAEGVRVAAFPELAGTIQRGRAGIDQVQDAIGRAPAANATISAS